MAHAQQDAPNFPEDESVEDAPSPTPEKSDDKKTSSKPEKAEKSAESSAAEQANGVRLRGLNKVSARASTLEGLLGTEMRFGNLEIIARRCWHSAPEDSPETAALLEIRELKPGEGAPQTIFNGWMFASSPALSALEHPVYDITVLSCVTLKNEN